MSHQIKFNNKSLIYNHNHIRKSTAYFIFLFIYKNSLHKKLLQIKFLSLYYLNERLRKVVSAASSETLVDAWVYLISLKTWLVHFNQFYLPRKCFYERLWSPTLWSKLLVQTSCPSMWSNLVVQHCGPSLWFNLVVISCPASYVNVM